MTYDPFQINAALGANGGMANPFHTPLTALQTSPINQASTQPPAGIQAFRRLLRVGNSAIPASTLFRRRHSCRIRY
jgi:hypothetical protein